MGAETKRIIEISREHNVVIIPGSGQGFNDAAEAAARMKIANYVYSAGINVLTLARKPFRTDERGTAGVALHYNSTETTDGISPEIEIFVGPPAWVKGGGIWKDVKEQPVTQTAREVAQRVLQFLVKSTTPGDSNYGHYLDIVNTRARLYTSNDGNSGDICSTSDVPVQLEQNPRDTRVIGPSVTLKYIMGCKTIVEKILGVGIKFI